MEPKPSFSESEQIEQIMLAGRNHFKTLIENSPTAIQIHSSDGMLRMVNAAWERLWGLKAHEVVGKFNIIEDNQAKQLGISQNVTRALTGESISLPEFVFDPTKSGYPGRKHWARSRIIPLRDGDQTIRNIVIAHEDLTDLIQTQEHYQIVVENAHEAIMIVQDGLMRFFNHKALNIAGYSKKEDYANKPFIDFVHPDYRTMIAERHRKRMAGENVPNFYQIKVLHKNGHALWLQLNVTRIEWEGRPASLAFIFDITDNKRVEDELTQYQLNLEELVEKRTRELKLKNEELQREINERKLVEKALRENQEHLKETQALGKIGHWEYDVDSRQILWSPIVYQLFERNTQQNPPSFEESLAYFFPTDSIRFKQRIDETIQSGKKSELEVNVKLPSGNIVFHHILFSPVKDDLGRISKIRGTVQDITERKKNENVIKAAHTHLQSIINGVAESIIVVDTDYRIKMMNEVASRKYTGNAPLNDVKFCYQLNHQLNEPCSGENHTCPMQIVAETKKPCTVTHIHLEKGNLSYSIELTASPIINENGQLTGIIEVGRDITERKLLEEEQNKLQLRLFEQQKIESLATLAGGVAHDFNNILMSVLGSAELLQRKMDPEGEIQKYIGLIIKSVHRMSHLTYQLLAYAKGGKYQPKIISLNKIVKESLALSHMGKAPELTSSLHLVEDLWPIFADPNQMIQMLVNLFTNAFEAMEDTGGCLTVKTSNMVKKEKWEDLFHNIYPAGEYIRVQISDTGVGIPEETQKRIFEPFFTTKFLGRGLGLAAVAGIAQNHGGSILVESSPNGGATFSIFLRRAKDTEESSASRQRLSHNTPKDKILIIDNESQIVEILKKHLTTADYDVITAEQGINALRLMEKHKKAINLVILDIQVSDMDGSAVFKALKTIKPGIGVIISSGYDEKTALSKIQLGPQDTFLAKPYEIEQLREKIELIFDEMKNN